MWNNNSGPPPFPSPHGGYNPSYGPPPGPPPSGYYPPPPGPPSGFPGAGYPPPQGPPMGYQPPQGPPPPVQRGSYPGGPPPPPVSRGSNYAQQFHPNGPPPRPPTEQQYYGPQYQDSQHHNRQPFFQYSQCTGKKKALCIGINYFGQDGELRGCINDANNMANFLCSHFGYKREDIVMLTDDNSNPRQIPTRANMIQAMQWLVRGAAPNDSLFLHYSGHGGQTKDLNGDEADGYDEVIYPVDHDTAGHLVDDDLHDIMVKPLPPGCRLTAIFDACHSASALDLPYVYSTEGKIKEPNLLADAGQGLLTAATSYARGDMGGVFSSVMGLAKMATGAGDAKKAEQLTRQTKTSPADCISFSGCKDAQTSADTHEGGQATGAMSYAFMLTLSQNPQQSYIELLNNVRDILRAKYSQKPQLAASHPIDTSLMFIC
uniref:Peptidase C14 caspase domain-containing protein n=1 Tax=Moniliophthora roreri TaxID=221103 RepID=A0A0W0EY84_MONRR